MSQQAWKWQDVGFMLGVPCFPQWYQLFLSRVWSAKFKTSRSIAITGNILEHRGQGSRQANPGPGIMSRNVFTTLTQVPV